MRVEPYQGRLAKCSALMKGEGIDVLLLTKPANMFYLTGDGRLCAYALITQDGQVALGVPSTDVEDVSGLAHFDRITGFEDEVGMIHAIAHDFEHFGIATGKAGLEYSFLTQAMLGMVTHPHAKPQDVVPVDGTAILSELRMVKEPQEIERIRAAAHVADAGMKAAMEAVDEGATEVQVAAAAELAMREHGAEGFWRTYVASGPRTNIAHGLPTRRRVMRHDLVMVDLHPIVDGYSADICRTCVAGEPTDAQRTAYELFLQAQQATIARLRAGVTMQELEETLHGNLKAAGHGGHLFGPPIHGLGIEFEEAPLPAGHAFFHGEKAPLTANVVLAVGNCRLYTGPWGVRVEDTVVVTREGHETLTGYPRSLQVRGWMHR